MKLNIGPHLSISKGYEGAGKTALEINANTFQFFSRNPRGGRAKALVERDIQGLDKIISKNKFAPLLVHAPYTLNMSSENEKAQNFARMVFADDLDRMEKLPCNLYNFHPGSHTGQGLEKGITKIVKILNETINENTTTLVLLETMSGKGTEIGKTFQELRAIIDRVEHKDKIGICFDTCHTFCAGYDIVNDLDSVLIEFDNVLGLERLKAIHLNDSYYAFKSFKDRHKPIGEGEIGLDAIVRFITHPKIKGIPLFLETPNDVDGYAREIKLLREIVED